MPYQAPKKHLAGKGSAFSRDFISCVGTELAEDQEQDEFYGILRQQLVDVYTKFKSICDASWESCDRHMSGKRTSKVFVMAPGDAPPPAPPAEEGTAVAPALGGANPPQENESEPLPAPATAVANGRVGRAR